MNGNVLPRKAAMVVAQRIVRDIARARLSPGAKLAPEREMLETYGIGRGTLREALRLLEFQGVISLKPGPRGGPVLQRPDSAHLASTFTLLMHLSQAPFRAVVEVRAALEPMISRLAAERIETASLRELESTVEQMSAHLEDQSRFLEANQRFHDIIAWSSGNPMFGYVVESLLGILDGTVLGIDYPAHRRAAILTAHENIFTALAERDAEAAEQRMRDHIDAYVRFANRRYPELLDRVIEWESLIT